MSAMHQNQLAHQRQADAETALRTVHRAVALAEQVKHHGQQFNRNQPLSSCRAYDYQWRKTGPGGS